MDISENISFTKASTNDIPLLCKMIKKLYENEKTPFVESDVIMALEKLVNHEKFGISFLIYLNDSLAGYMILTSFFSVEFKGEAAFLDELYVNENFRGKGIGLKAVGHAEEYAIAKGYKALRLEVEHSNLAAQGLYKNKGFNIHERHIMTKWLIK